MLLAPDLLSSLSSNHGRETILLLRLLLLVLSAFAFSCSGGLVHIVDRVSCRA